MNNGNVIRVNNHTINLNHIVNVISAEITTKDGTVVYPLECYTIRGQKIVLYDGDSQQIRDDMHEVLDRSFGGYFADLTDMSKGLHIDSEQPDANSDNNNDNDIPF